jgi:hypothetical protein
MKKITRTFEEHIFYPAIVTVKDGSVTTEDLEPLVIEDESYTEDKAIKLTKKNYGKNKQYVILKKETYQTKYEMPLDFFKVNATETERSITDWE